MDWPQTKRTVLADFGKLLQPRGYRFVKSRDAFEKSSPTERRGFYAQLVASRHGTYRLNPWCGIRNNAIEEVFHRTSGIDKKYRANYTTIILVADDRWYLNSDADVRVAVTEAGRFITDVALPFLEREYSYSDYSTLLNATPSSVCQCHASPQNRCHYGLIAARLAADPHYDELKRVYSEFLQSTNNGFYYPRFRKLVADLET